MTTTDDLKTYNCTQLHEIDKFKWYLGVNLGFDPLNIYSLNEIYMMWISQHAKTFREDWEKQHACGRPDCKCN